MRLEYYKLDNNIYTLKNNHWFLNEEKISEVYRIILLFNMALGIIFFILLTFFPIPILSIFAKDTATINSALDYISFIRYTFLIYPISIAIGSSFRFIGLVKLAMYVAMITVVINVFFNYLLIYGNFGFPALGVYPSLFFFLLSLNIGKNLIPAPVADRHRAVGWVPQMPATQLLL